MTIEPGSNFFFIFVRRDNVSITIADIGDVNGGIGDVGSAESRRISIIQIRHGSNSHFIVGRLA